MRNNIIAIVAITFVMVGALWGVGNLLEEEEERELPVESILLITNRNTFNETNPDINVKVGVPAKLVVRNDDVIAHNLRVDGAQNEGITPVNTAYLPAGRDFPTAIVTQKPGTYEYYCELHPEMRGDIIAQ
jgi:plastocyanin